MDQNDAKETKTEKYPLFPSTRCSIYVMLFITCMVQYAARFALNMSIVCMVVPDQQRGNESAQDENDAIVQALNTSLALSSSCQQRYSEKKDFGFEGEFYWSRPQVGYILAAFSYAYIPMQVVAGLLADKFGVRHVLGTGMLIGGILVLLTPVAARLHYGLLIALRLLMGFAMGMVFPCIHSIVGKWVPSSERGTFFGLVFSGPNAGNIISFVLSGYLCQFSWTIVFYLVGCVVILYYFSFLYIVYNSPDEHPRISAREKQFIKDSNKLAANASKKPVRIPWRRMLTSRSMFGMCLSHFSVIWLINTLGVGIPLYLQDVMYFSIKANGVLSSLPHITILVCSVNFGILIDVVHRRIITSRRVLRKLSETLFAGLTIVCAVSASFMNCNQNVEVIVMFCLIYLAVCFRRGGMACGPSDVAPRMAGLVYGVTNFVGNFSGFLAPIAIGNLTKNKTQAEWQRVFFILAGVVGVGWLGYVFCVGTYEEEWAKEKPETADTEDGDENDLEMKIKLTSEDKNEYTDS